MGPFKCYVTQWGEVKFPENEGVWFNVISITRGWADVKFLEKMNYVTLEWPLSAKSIDDFRGACAVKGNVPVASRT